MTDEHRLASVSSASAEALTDATVIELVARYPDGATGKELSDTLTAAGYATREAQRYIQRNLDRGTILLGPGLRIYTPEPVPATNQAGEVANLRQALRNIAEGNLGDAPWQANYARIKEVATAALATQPATSQEGERLMLRERIDTVLHLSDAKPLTGELSDIALTLLREAAAQLAVPSAATSQEGEAVAWCSPGQLANLTDVDRDGGVYLPVRKTKRGNFTMPLFAATPTPPTLSEDLREVLERVVRSDQVRDWGAKCDNPISTSDWVWRDGRYIIVDWAALAQVRAS